jgi:hypothetical protein
VAADNSPHNISFAPYRGLDGFGLTAHGFTVDYYRSLLRNCNMILKTCPTLHGFQYESGYVVLQALKKFPADSITVHTDLESLRNQVRRFEAGVASQKDELSYK